MAEVYGPRGTACARASAGRLHLTDVKRGFLGTSGIVGAGIPHAAGAAWAAQTRKKAEVVYCFFGDGASKQGAFHETLNIASLWKLPVIFVMENNGYNVVTTLRAGGRKRGERPSRSRSKPKRTRCRASRSMGADPLAVHAAVGAAVERARAGAGPTLVESKVYRLSGARQHHRPAPACRCTIPSTRPSQSSASARSTRRLCAATPCHAFAPPWLRPVY